LSIASLANLSVAILAFTSTGHAQKMVTPADVPCSTEIVTPNLEMKEKTHLSGELKDATGAPFADSQVTLRMFVAKYKTVLSRTVSTDKAGRFDLGLVDTGKYRFLPAANRGFKQPKKVVCNGGHDCEISLVLEVNPTDQPFAGCPIQ
jgi:hypothetical protein